MSSRDVAAPKGAARGREARRPARTVRAQPGLGRARRYVAAAWFWFESPRQEALEAGRDFKQMVRVTMRPVGRGRKVAVADRVEVENLTPAAALADKAIVQFVVAS